MSTPSITSAPSNLNYGPTITSFTDRLGFSSITWGKSDSFFYKSQILPPTLANRIANKMARILKLNEQVMHVGHTSAMSCVIISDLPAFTRALGDYNNNLSDSAEQMKNSVVRNIAEKANTGPLTAEEWVEVNDLINENHQISDMPLQALAIKEKVICSERDAVIVLLNSITKDTLYPGVYCFVVTIMTLGGTFRSIPIGWNLTAEQVRTLIEILKD